MNHRPTIAVVMPNRNDAAALPRALRSVLHQVPPPDEFIVIDDWSTDDSRELIEREICQFPFARLIENKTWLGTIATINRGLREARCEFVVFLSSNDCMLPGLVGHAKAALRAHPEAGLWSAMTWLMDEGGRSTGLHWSPVVALDDRWMDAIRCRALAVGVGSWFAGPTMCFRRAALDAIGGFDDRLGGLSDLLAATVVSSRHGAVFSPVPLALLRVHEGGVLSATLRDEEGVERLIAIATEYVRTHAPTLPETSFLARMEGRIRFAALRARSEAEARPSDAGPGASRTTRALNTIRARASIVRAFVALRAFDVCPTLLYRLLGAAIIRVRYRRPAGSSL